MRQSDRRFFHHARQSRALGVCILAAAVVAICGRADAVGLIIVPTFDTTITSDPNAATIEGTINSAIAIYQARFSDPITVNITFAKGGGLGSSSTFFANISYSQYRTALGADASTADDATALLHLPNVATDPVLGHSTINVKTANLRAVGINVNLPSDGTVTLNTTITSPGSPGTTNQFSLQAVAEHEIDEVLGLGSALPTPPNSAIFPEDLFRYDASGNRSFNTNNSLQAFFSIDGTTLLDQFNNVNNGGDYGDWIVNNPPQVQDFAATPGSNPNLGVELRALDVVGYNLLPVPEPGSVILLAIGSLGLAAIRPRLRRQAG